MTYEDWLYLHIIEIKPALAGWETCNEKTVFNYWEYELNWIKGTI